MYIEPILSSIKSQREAGGRKVEMALVVYRLFSAQMDAPIESSGGWTDSVEEVRAGLLSACPIR